MQDGITASPADGIEPLVDAEEIAALLHVTPRWVNESARRGRIPSIPCGRYRRFKKSAVLHSLENESTR
jgi:excisionase family DNA binding protein